MQLSERAINSLETVLREAGRCFSRCRCICRGETGVICIQGQQSSRNYAVPSANGSEESTQILFTLWDCSARWREAQVKSKTLNKNHTYAEQRLVDIWGGKNAMIISLLLDLIRLGCCRKGRFFLQSYLIFKKNTDGQRMVMT